MTTKFVALISVNLASTCGVQAQPAVPPELPAESPSPAKKHRQHEMAEATASPASCFVCNGRVASSIAQSESLSQKSTD
jgi:hypothetical protein